MSVEIELRATRMEDGDVVWCSAESAEQFSVYVGKPGSFIHIEDFPTETWALACAERWSSAWGAPVHNRIERAEPIPIPDEQIDPHNARLSAGFVLMGFRDTASSDIWRAAKTAGELELVATLTDYGLDVERAWMEFGRDDAPGVWDYEVSEPFGAWLAKQVEATGRLPTRDVAMARLREMGREFFAQGEPA